MADQYRRLQQIRDTIENKNYNEQAILEILYGCVEVIEIHNNGDIQRLGGYEAYGPILLGLNAPINDLSRGCNADEVFKMAIITAGMA